MWEAWLVFPGHSQPILYNNDGYDDDLGFENANFDGKLTTTITASARYYEGLDELPSDFHRGIGQTHSGNLWSSYVDPNFSLENATAPVIRTSTYVNP